MRAVGCRLFQQCPQLGSDSRQVIAGRLVASSQTYLVGTDKVGTDKPCPYIALFTKHRKVPTGYEPG